MSALRCITIEVPSVRYAGDYSDAFFLRTAARNLDEGYPVGGSNVSAAVAGLLRNAANALDAIELASVEPDRTTLIDLARRRRTQARALGDDYREAAWFATRVAAEDIDGTGRTPTDAELGAVVRALAQDEADADAKVQEQITRLLEERGR